eukprot:1493321-Alexandrium_andersonii.AAC.1
MAAQESSVSSQIRRAILTGAHAAELPTPRSVHRRRSQEARALWSDGGSTWAELHAEFARLQWRSTAPPGLLFFDEAASNVDGG